MNIYKFWTIVHGGTTHFPIGLLLASFLFDAIGYFLKDEKSSRDLHAAGFYSLILGAIGSFAAVISGLALTDWSTWGSGSLLKHHEFVWPAFGLLVALAVWRVLVRERITRTGFGVYLAFATAVSVLMSAAGYWGGEIR